MDPDRDAAAPEPGASGNTATEDAPKQQAWRWWLLVLLGVVALTGLWLVLFAGDEPPQDSESGSDTLELADTDAESVAALAGLELPDSVSDFLTARLGDDSQLDVTFTIEAGDEGAFIEGSALAAPVPGDRVIIHASPLWELNTTGTIRGSTDTYGAGRGATGDPGTDDSAAGVRRSVELVEEGDRVRVRMVITPA